MHATTPSTLLKRFYTYAFCGRRSWCVCVCQQLEFGILHCNQFLMQNSFLSPGHILLVRSQCHWGIARSNQKALLEMTLLSLDMIQVLQQQQQEGS